MDTAPASTNDRAGLDPQTADALRRLAARVDEIEFLLDAVSGFLQRGPEIADNLGDAVIEMRESIGGDGASTRAEVFHQLSRLKGLSTPEKVAELVTALEAFTEVLGSQQVQAFLQSDLVPAAEALTRLAGRVDELEFMLEMLTGFMQRGPEIADNLNDAVNDMREAAVGGASSPVAETLLRLKALATPETLDTMVTAAEGVHTTLASPQVQSLLQSTILDPVAIGAVSEIAEALVVSMQTARTHPRSVGGPFALMKALRDPDVARTMGFALEFARIFGRHLSRMQSDA